MTVVAVNNARILILGGYGAAGRLIARHLLARTGANVILAGRSIDRARTVAGELNAEFAGARASSAMVEAADERGLREALRDAQLLVVSAPTTRHTEGVVRAALDAGVDYLDIQLSDAKLAVLRSFASRIEQEGRCFITEAGFHPGLPSAMVRYAANQVGDIEAATVACYLNVGTSLPYSEAADELMEVFGNYQAQVFRDGAWTKKGSFTSTAVEFGGDIGRRRCYPMFFEELRALPGMFPALRNAGFYIADSHWLVDWVLVPLAILGMKIAPRLTIRPAGKLVWWGMRTFSRPPAVVHLRVEARGRLHGTPVTAVATVSHDDAYELTAIPVVAYLLQYLDGSARRHGLWMMGHIAEPVRLFRDMAELGARVTSTATPDVTAASGAPLRFR